MRFCETDILADSAATLASLCINPLPLHKLRKESFLCDQFVIAAVLDDVSLIQDNDAVTLLYR